MPTRQAFPTAGEEFGEFRLLRELGRGGAGRVFLATQPLLSDRPLVVKLTPRTGDEHLSLARLQHTHIVPLFLVQEFPERNLRALCMPFLGGASWSAILQASLRVPTTERSGDGIVAVLKKAESELGLILNSSGPAIGFLSQASYEQAVCWIGSCLAEGLHHAHERGLLHLDIKPSNVLLAGDGQPMLLDFHLAHEVGPGAVRSSWIASAALPATCRPNNSFRFRQCARGTGTRGPRSAFGYLFVGCPVVRVAHGKNPARGRERVARILHEANPRVSRCAGGPAAQMSRARPRGSLRGRRRIGGGFAAACR